MTPSPAQITEVASVASINPLAAQLGLVALLVRAAELTDLITHALDEVDHADTTLAAAIEGALAVSSHHAVARVPASTSGDPAGMGPPNVTALNWKQITANLAIGTKINITNNLAALELRKTPDPVLAAVTGNRHLVDSAGPRITKRIPVVGTAVTLLSTQASVNSDIKEGLSPAEAYVSNYAGAGAGIAAGIGAGAAAGALAGSVVPGVGTVTGAVVGAAFSALASEGASQMVTKGIQWMWR